MRPWNEKGELKEKGKRVGKQNLLIKGGNYRRKARRQKNSCIKTPKTIHINKTTQNPYWGSRTDPMITGIQHRYWYQYQYQYHHQSPKNHEPLPLTYTQNSRTQSQNQEPMNQDSRVKNHEFMPHHFPLLKILGPRVKNQNQRTKTQGPRTVSLNLSLYSIFNNPESKTKTQRTKTQGPRTMSHEWKPEPKSETHRTKIQDPKTITN